MINCKEKDSLSWWLILFVWHLTSNTLLLLSLILYCNYKKSSCDMEELLLVKAVQWSISIKIIWKIDWTRREEAFISLYFLVFSFLLKDFFKWIKKLFWIGVFFWVNIKMKCLASKQQKYIWHLSYQKNICDVWVIWVQALSLCKKVVC